MLLQSSVYRRSHDTQRRRRFYGALILWAAPSCACFALRFWEKIKRCRFPEPSHDKRPDAVKLFINRKEILSFRSVIRKKKTFKYLFLYKIFHM